MHGDGGACHATEDVENAGAPLLDHTGDHESKMKKDGEKDINVEAAYIHALGDLVQARVPLCPSHPPPMIGFGSVWFDVCSPFRSPSAYASRVRSYGKRSIPLSPLPSITVEMRSRRYLPYEKQPLAQLADPIATFIFSIVVLYTTFMVLRTSLNILMEGKSSAINYLSARR